MASLDWTKSDETDKAHMYTILLTACINPDGMSFTKLTDKDVRLEQYMKALHHYLKATHYPIVFAENSNTDISSLFTDETKAGRLEVLTFSGNEDKSKGKGYGEAKIIEHAISHSKLLDEDTKLIKITGRLIVDNLQEVLARQFPLRRDDSLVCAFNSDLSFADSRLIIAPVSFYRQFLKDKEAINDNENHYFEHVLAANILNNHAPFVPFWTEPSIVGISGSTGQDYVAAVNTRSRTIDYRLMALHRYSLYYQKTNKRMNATELLSYHFLRLKYHLLRVFS